MTTLPHRRKEDRFPHRVLGFFKRFFIVMGIAATISLVSLFVTLDKVVHYVPPSLPDRMVLTYTFKSGITETAGRPSLSQPLLRPATTLHEIIDDLTQAAKDPRVKGFAARLQNADLTAAQIQELRDAVAGFRKSGKTAVIFSENLGGPGAGTRNYYLASAFDKIWLQPVGTVAVNGIAAEVPFFRGVMDKAGVEAQFSHKGTYKSAPESLTETGMSAPSREMMTGLIGDLAEQIVAGIAENRKLAPGDVRRLIDGAPYTGNEALALKLIDRIGYYGEMLDEIRGGDKTIELVGLQGYSFKDSTLRLNQGMPGFTSKFFRKSEPAHATRGKTKIALIFGAGDIIPHRRETRAAFGEGDMPADRIVAAFEEAREDKNVAAVVFRIDSPGGSPEAAESIRRAVVETQKKGKPVVVSMGGYAASGGYWIAAPADKIVAQPATLTGSIGVFGGKIVLAQLWEKLGIRWESVSAGEKAGMWSSNTGFSENEKKRFEALLDDIYESFIARVMEGRKMTRDQVVAVAEGRVWTGRQAKEKGLVDELGGLDKAVLLAKAAAGLPPDQDVPLKRFPALKSTLELFIELATEGASIATPGFGLSAEELMQSAKAAAAPEIEMLKAPKIKIY